MGFKTFADGNAFTGADINSFIERQVIAVVTSGTRPATPVEGEPIYETDTDRLLLYTTATTGWRQPWNMPWGLVASPSQTTSQTGITTTVDLTSLSVSVALVQNRLYKCTLNVDVQQLTSAATANLNMLVAGTQFANAGISTGINLFYQVHLTGFFTAGSTASQTIKAQAATTAGSLSTSVSATAPAVLLVEDVGPAGAPV